METTTAGRRNRLSVRGGGNSACAPGTSWVSIKNNIKRIESLSHEKETSLFQDIEKGKKATALLEGKTLQADEDLFASYAGDPDPKSRRAWLKELKERGERAREQLIKEVGYRQVVFLAEGMAMLAGVKDRSFGEEDLFQEGLIGFMQALEKFDWKRGNHLGTYARKAILRTMQRALNEKGCCIRVPNWLKDEAVKAKKTRERLEKELGRVPADEEVAGSMGVSLEHLNGTERFGLTVESLEDLQGEGKEVELFELGSELSSAEAVATPDAALEKREMRKEVRDLLPSLDPVSLRVVETRYGFDGEPRSLKEIGDRDEKSGEWARKKCNKALEELRPIAEKRGLRAFLKSA